MQKKSRVLKKLILGCWKVLFPKFLEEADDSIVLIGMAKILPQMGKQKNSMCLPDVDMWQSMSLLNGQRPIEAFGTNIAGFY